MGSRSVFQDSALRATNGVARLPTFVLCGWQGECGGAGWGRSTQDAGSVLDPRAYGFTQSEVPVTWSGVSNRVYSMDGRGGVLVRRSRVSNDR